MIRHRWIVAAWLALVPAALAAQGGGSGGSGSSGGGSGSSGGSGGGKVGGITPEQREAIRQERQERRNGGGGGLSGEGRDGGGSGGGNDSQHPLLEQRVRERFALVVRNQLRLDDKQMRQLGDVSRRFEGRRRDLNQRERSARDVLRTEVAADRNADNPRVASALQEILTIQKERSAVLEDEDKELSSFLSPVQRARWFALQDQLRRRVEQMRRRAEAGLDPAGVVEPPGEN